MRNQMRQITPDQVRERVESPKAVLALVLVFALMLVQSTQLHLHFYDHSDHHHELSSHPNYDLSAHAHGDEVAEFEFAQDGFAKQLSSGSMVIALFALVFLLAQRLEIARHRWRLSNTPLYLESPYSLRPPQRAPPL